MRSHQQATRDDVATEIAESVHTVVQVQRFAEGRRVSEIVAVDGYDRDRKAFTFRTVYDLRRAHAAIGSTFNPNTQEDSPHATA